MKFFDMFIFLHQFSENIEMEQRYFILQCNNICRNPFSFCSNSKWARDIFLKKNVPTTFIDISKMRHARQATIRFIPDMNLKANHAKPLLSSAKFYECAWHTN